MCVVVSAPKGSETWRMRRSVEVLSFHRAEREVRVLLGLYVQNNEPNNWLGIMHQGDVDLILHPAWPLPHHPDERGRRTGVLSDLYGKLFEEIDGTLYQSTTITAWDQQVEVRRHSLQAWRPGQGGVLLPEPVPERASYIPFTTWKLGPFPEATSYLITFELRIAGSTYDHLVEQGESFTVDGPRRLLSTFRYMELPHVAPRERDFWSKRLAAFENGKLLLGEGYDIIVLRPWLGDAVEFLRGGIGIAPAPLQPRDDVGLRFTTVDQSFSIGLRYANTIVEDQAAEIVAYR